MLTLRVQLLAIAENQWVNFSYESVGKSLSSQCSFAASANQLILTGYLHLVRGMYYPHKTTFTQVAVGQQYLTISPTDFSH
jgi:hypothetical protein